MTVKECFTGEIISEPRAESHETAGHEMLRYAGSRTEDAKSKRCHQNASGECPQTHEQNSKGTNEQMLCGPLQR